MYIVTCYESSCCWSSRLVYRNFITYTAANIIFLLSSCIRDGYYVITWCFVSFCLAANINWFSCYFPNDVIQIFITDGSWFLIDFCCCYYYVPNDVSMSIDTDGKGYIFNLLYLRICPITLLLTCTVHTSFSNKWIFPHSSAQILGDCSRFMDILQFLHTPLWMSIKHYTGLWSMEF